MQQTKKAPQILIHDIKVFVKASEYKWIEDSHSASLLDLDEPLVPGSKRSKESKQVSNVQIPLPPMAD